MIVRASQAAWLAIVALLLIQNPAFVCGQDATNAQADSSVTVQVALQDNAKADPQDAQKEDEGEGDDLDDLDFLDQDLSEIRNTQVTEGAMNTEIESVSRTAQPLAKTPAAVYVITNEMIKRSGARNIPDVLRMAPGVNVARITSDTWAISIRGFNGQYANKLLVQIDGRAVYTPTFSGVLWNQQRLLLEDVDRIEIIRGPGGTVWGANAVNGIISISTKKSADTQGLYGEIGGGNEHQLFSGLRAGGAINDDVTFRLWGTQVLDDSGYVRNGTAEDGFSAGQGGYRVDWTPTNWDTVTLQGDFLGGWAGQVDSTDVKTGNTIFRWTHQIDEDRDWSFQTYWDQYSNNSPSSHVFQNVFDFDFQYHARVGSRNDVVAGVGYRNSFTELEFSPTSPLNFTPPRDTFDVISYFVQDTIELVDDRLFATLGCKFLHNDFTEFEYQPTIKVAWTPDERTSVWGSISRAVRTPAVVDRDLVFTQMLSPGPPFPTSMRVYGDRGIDSEDVMSYEAGIRQQTTDEFFWDLAAFFNRYNNLMAIRQSGMVLPPPQMFIDFLTVNTVDADTYGFELAGTYKVSDCWRVRGSYSFFVENIDIPADAQAFVTYPGLSPKNQVYVNSGWDIDDATTLNVQLRYVDNLSAGVPNYFVADVRVARMIAEGLEVSIVGQNLFDNHHPEFNSSGMANGTEVENGVYGMVSYQY